MKEHIIICEYYETFLHSKDLCKDFSSFFFTWVCNSLGSLLIVHEFAKSCLLVLELNANEHAEQCPFTQKQQ